MLNRDLTKGMESAVLHGDRQKQEAESASQSLWRSAQELTQLTPQGIKLRQAVAEFAGTLAAGITGAVVWSLGTTATRGLGKAASLSLAMGAGGAVKYGVKSGLEHLLLDKQYHTASKADLAWGAVDGLAGVGGSLAEKQISENFLTSLGRKALGPDISATMAEMAGSKLVAQSIGPQIQHNFYRGLAGGAAGGFIWSVPHSLFDHRAEIKQDPLSGLSAAKNQILSDTLTATVLGGGFGGLGTAILRSPRIIKHGWAALEGDAHVTRLDIAHINDLHSELAGSHGLPRIATKLSELKAQSAANGRSSHFYVAGDVESGNVVFSFTKGGYAENESLARMGVDAIIPGNHPYDIAGGGYDIGRYAKVMSKVAERREYPLLAANLDLSAYPEYQKLVKPYVVREIQGAHGPEKMGVIGLITEEGAMGKIRHLDPVEAAEKYIGELHGQGVDKVVVLSHMGLSQDIQLAKSVKGISAIVGGHSHDFEVVPRWVRQGSDQGGIFGWFKPNSDRYGGWDVPIVQAGSNGRWLGELNLAFQPGGAADYARTTGRLYPITKNIAADRDIEKFVNGFLTDLDDLRSVQYNSESVAPYSLTDVRVRETALGNLVADSMVAGLRKQLGGDSVDIALMNSGGIRAGVKAHDPITRLDLANIFMNAGKPHHEAKELYLLKMTGKQIRDALEYGVHDLDVSAGVQAQNLAQRLRLLLNEPPSLAYGDEPGNFLQVSGLKYSFDMSRPPRLTGQSGAGRVKDIMVQSHSGNFAPIRDDEVYTVAARLHAVAKWHMDGIFGSQRHLKQTLTLTDARPTGISQVDLLGDFIEGKTLDPRKISKVDGRIRDLTARALEPTVRPGISLLSFSTMSGRSPYREVSPALTADLQKGR